MPKGIKGFQKGYTISEETRRKMSIARKGKRNPMWGKRHSIETRRKYSETRKGKNSYNYGKHPSKETRKKMSEAQKGEKHPMWGKHHSKETKEKLKKSRMGRLISEETRRKIGESNKGKHHSEETKKRISELKKGKHPSKETRRKLSESHKGEKSSFWKGGISFAPYSIDWKKSLKISIRERDKYTCQICHKRQGDKAFAVHHIDYNKLNCNVDNLITLCGSCHSKTSSNRKYWINYFKFKN